MPTTRTSVIEKVFFILALFALACLALIAIFIFSEGLPFLLQNGIGKFLLSSDWHPDQGSFGIFPMLVSSILLTFGALLVGLPLALAGAIFLVEFASPGLRRVIKPAIELLAGIPSVVFGFIGVMVLAPFIRTVFGGPGLSLLAAAIILGIMILPTIMSISIDALSALPQSYREGALALGATQWQAIHLVTIQAARSGIVAGIILGMGRAIGETMAVIMVAGNAANLPKSPLDSIRTLTANIALEMGFAVGKHREALFATGVVLFLLIMLLNAVALVALRKKFKI